jgi:hypothetical protein
MASRRQEVPVFPRLAASSFDRFRDDLAAAEQAAAESRIEWDVREAQLERRLAALHARALNMSRRAAPKLPMRDPVALYSSRWSHAARSTLLLAK